MSKDRWFEITVDHRKTAATNETEFVDSLDLKSTQGKTIGEGASQTLGDQDPDAPDAPATVDAAPKDVVDPLIILAKPRAGYTDEARHENLQGLVRLRITLLRNGSLGKIDTLSTLKYGLTEQAIAAAKKIVFLPKQINGVRVNSVVTFEYSFSIY